MKIKSYLLEHLPLLPIATWQLMSHDQLSIWAWRPWQAAQVTREFPVCVDCTLITYDWITKIPVLILISPPLFESVTIKLIAGIRR